MNVNAIVLAAGKGTRMKSNKPKVVQEVLYKPMVKHVVDELHKAKINNIVVIVGHQAQMVQDVLKNDQVEFAFQHELLGSAHAILQAKSLLEGKDGYTFVLNGDAPLIEASMIEDMLETHIQNKYSATVMSSSVDYPNTYGRMVKYADGTLKCITEFKDANEEERKIKEANCGIYCFNNEGLFKIIESIDNNNTQNEYYITDSVKKYNKLGLKVGTYEINDFDEVGGIDTKIDIVKANKRLKERINNYHLLNGVTIIDPSNTYIGRDVSIGADTIIEPGCILKGKTEIGSDCVIGPYSEITDTKIGNHVILKYVVISDSIIDDKVDIGPFARLRGNCHIYENVHIGNFVEMKNTHFGKGSKSAHLSYVGDAEVGADVNIGCGVITSNYDGLNKFKTIIKDNAFIGCNTNLVAPVTVEEEGYVVAGSTITNDVPEKAVAFARARQVNKEGYAEVLKTKREKIKKNK